MKRNDATPLLQDFLIASAQRHPEKAALVSGEHRLTYAELDRRTNALAHALLQRGVVRGDRVFVYGDSSVETVISFWAALKANAAPSVINPQTKADKLRFLLSDCRPTALLATARLAPLFTQPASEAEHLRTALIWGKLSDETMAALPTAAAWEGALEEAPDDRPPERRAIDIDLAAIIYTSGSTGDPKGVMLSHRNMLTAAASVSTYLEMQPDDVIMNVLPLSFDYGLYQTIMACRLGARLVLEHSFTYPAQVLQKMATEGVTGFPGVPTIFAVLSSMKNLDRYDLSAVRFVSNTAAALMSKHISTIQRTFPNARVFSMYGLTECKRISYLPPDEIDRKPDSVGVPIPNTEFWVVDDQDRRLGPNEVGQLVVRGATVMMGYWQRPAETAARLRTGVFPGERVLYTGDYARLDDDGYLYFIGRMDDIIKSRGEKVAPKEVERVLTDIPGVLEVAVVGVDDEILGQAVKAFVVPEPGVELSQAALIRECQRRLEAFMAPKYVEFVSDLPKTTTGKINKSTLK